MSATTHASAHCYQTEIVNVSNRQNNPHIDHNHKTNKIRGILCGNCNMGLGHFKDNLDVLKNAIKYLEDTDG